MSLITCKKCKKIVASGSEPCPYCGEPDPGGTHTHLILNEGDSRSVWMGFVMLALLIVLLVQWAFRNSNPESVDGANPVSVNNDCMTAECPAGTKAVAIATRMQPFYSCKSGELSEYTNEVLSVMINQVRDTGSAPEISSKTGEPVVQGKDKATLDQYRAKAHVSSFEEAISRCYRGRGQQKVVVLYSPSESRSIYVAAEEDQKNKFWLPKSRLFKQ